MRAVTFNEHGGPRVLRYRTDLVRPAPGPGEVLVRVEATGLNQVDRVVRLGYPGLKVKMPHVLGADIVGTVESVGDRTAGVEEGARVAVYPIVSCGDCALCRGGDPNLCVDWQYFGLHRSGSYAEHVVVPAENVLRLPDSLSFEHAVAVPVAGLTAYHALVGVAKLKPDQTFFIWGGAGALGTVAIQIAKHLGATVIATGSSQSRLEVMSSLGADVVLDRYRDDVLRRVREAAPLGVDVVLDYVGPQTFPTSFEMLKKGGQMLLCGIITSREATVSLHMTYLRHLSLKGLYLGTRAEMEALLGLIDEGVVVPHIEQRFPLEDAAAAHELLDSGQTVGKVLLTF